MTQQDIQELDGIVNSSSKKHYRVRVAVQEWLEEQKAKAISLEGSRQRLESIASTMLQRAVLIGAHWLDIDESFGGQPSNPERPSADQPSRQDDSYYRPEAASIDALLGSSDPPGCKFPQCCINEDTACRCSITAMAEKRMEALEDWLNGKSFDKFLADSNNWQRWAFVTRGETWRVLSVNLAAESLSARSSLGFSWTFTFDYFRELATPAEFFRTDWERFKQSLGEPFWMLSYKDHDGSQVYQIDGVRQVSGEPFHIISYDARGTKCTWTEGFIEKNIESFTFFEGGQPDYGHRPMSCPWCHVEAKTVSLVLFKDRTVECPQCHARCTAKCFSEPEDEVWSR